MKKDRFRYYDARSVVERNCLGDRFVDSVGKPFYGRITYLASILVSFTRIHVAPVNFVKQAPYVVLIAQLAEEVRVTGRLLGDQWMSLTIGDSLQYVKKDEIGWWFQRTVRK
ncbi:hypothetical protein CULT_10140 [[Clostridium] ultunense Esp]|nr:hypothetical protein CULT_10140 [[Clostridium] ultunense Esp]